MTITKTVKKYKIDQDLKTHPNPENCDAYYLTPKLTFMFWCICMFKIHTTILQLQLSTFSQYKQQIIPSLQGKPCPMSSTYFQGKSHSAIKSGILTLWYLGSQTQSHTVDDRNPATLQGTNISRKNGILKMIFLFPRWDMLIPWRVTSWGKGSSSHYLKGF